MKYIAYDLGTGGVKASLYDENLTTLSKSFIEYDTFYPQSNMHEQKPEDWWDSVVKSTKALLTKTQVDAQDIGCIALSGHSCVAVPLDRNLKLLEDTVPIWSDTRAGKQIQSFFQKVDEKEWYLCTGNGFPASCYSIFKLMWLKDNKPEIFSSVYKVAGSKDYINLRMTGNLYTDYSYASSSGVYDLKKKSMRPEFLEAAGIPGSVFPEIVPSHHQVGTLLPEAAEELGLHTGVVVSCGGVDNACMALGAVGAQEGAVYTSLGSSSWIPINSKEPILDYETKPYVFAHIDESMFTSAYSIFAGGSSYRWARNNLCSELPENEAYKVMDQLAASSPIGSNGIIFNPSLAGGTSQDKSVNIRGAFIGLHLGTTRADLIRATLEGISLNLRISLELLAKHTSLSSQLLFCGGGSKSKFWMQMFADIFNMNIIKTNIDQDAASLGAAAICARAVGAWSDYSKIPDLHQVEFQCTPNTYATAKYDRIYQQFKHISNIIADLGDYMTNS